VTGDGPEDDADNILCGVYSLAKNIVCNRPAPGFNFPVYLTDNIPLCIVVDFAKARQLIERKAVDMLPV
jgi:hypothetical protein